MRFLDIVSRGFSEGPDDSECCDDLKEDGRRVESALITFIMSGRRVGKHPDMIPMEGSTEDQMKTSLFAQLMSFDWTRWVMVMMR